MLSKRHFIIFTLLVLILLVSGCSDSGDSPTSPSNSNNTEPTFTNVNSILQSSCSTNSASCHGGSNPASGLLMTSYNSIIGDVASTGKTVDSGNAMGSNLYLKVTNNPPFGNRMPLGRDTLTTTQQQLIRDWINNGAKND